MPAVQISSAEESDETLTIFRNDVARQVLRQFMGYQRKNQGRSYVNGRIMSIASLAAWVETVERCLVERKKHGEH